MDIKLQELYAKDYKFIKQYLEKRDPGICDAALIDNYMWHNYYNSKYFVTDNALCWVHKMREEYFTILPLCLPENLKENFDILVDYFNNVLNEKLKIYIADEEGLQILNLDESKFKIEENRDYFDYVYSGDDLRTLKGKKLHKKKNHYNSFLKEYEGRYEYKKVCCSNKSEIMEFLDSWYGNKISDDIYNRLEQEYIGIKYVLEHCTELDYKMASVYVDGKVEAFTLGSYSATNDMAFVHVEKANPEIRGLYNFINKEFLCNEYPNAKLVNREDDMGLEGLRKAKLSYKPLYLAKKYSIIQI